MGTIQKKFKNFTLELLREKETKETLVFLEELPELLDMNHRVGNDVEEFTEEILNLVKEMLEKEKFQKNPAFIQAVSRVFYRVSLSISEE